MTSIKGVIGHTLAAAGAIEAVAAALTFAHAPDPADDRDDRGGPRDSSSTWSSAGQGLAAGPGVSNSFGFGGHNGTLVLVPA